MVGPQDVEHGHSGSTVVECAELEVADMRGVDNQPKGLRAAGTATLQDNRHEEDGG